MRHILLLLISVLLACYYQPAKSQDLELIGHRGATGFMPENTIAGFKKALEFDINSIEFDVVISGDEQVVVSHEPWFRHDICLTPEGESIDEDSRMDHLMYRMNYEEIAKYDCGSIQREGYPDQETEPLAKPLMKDAIREVELYRKEKNRDPIMYNVEIKSDPSWDNELQPPPARVAELVYRELDDLDVLDRIRIFAFDTRILHAVHEIDSTVSQVYLISGSETDLEENLSKLSFTPDIYAPNYSLVDSALVSQVHSRGMLLIPWTVNRYEDMLHLIELGVDGLISDYPNYFGKLRDRLPVAEDGAD